MNSWFPRRGPRLSGSLHIRDAAGRELIMPLRGRDILLTADGSGVPGYGAAWAVHTGPEPAASGNGNGNGIMIVYGPTESVDDRRSGICEPGRTISLGGVDFTWITGTGVRVPVPRSPARNASPTLRSPQRHTTNTRASLIRASPQARKGMRAAPAGAENGTRTAPAAAGNTMRTDAAAARNGMRAEEAAGNGIGGARGLGDRLRNMVRIVTRARVKR